MTIIVPKFSRYQELLALLASLLIKEQVQSELFGVCKMYDGKSDRTLHTGADMSDS